MASSSFAGPNLALLMLGGFRKLVDAAVVELAERGFDDVRVSENFAMRAIEAGADGASELGRRMSVTKQAAAKIIEGLVERGYVVREPDPDDARRKRLALTALGSDLLRQGEDVFNQLRASFARQIGRQQLQALEAHLAQLVGGAPVRVDAPGWVAQAI